MSVAMQNDLIQDDLYGLVLSGGRSKRMGIDKGTIRYHDKSQREYLFDLLTSFCGRVYTSCNPAQSVEESFNPLFDAYDLDGPMNGIMSAFSRHPEKAWLIVAIDLPNVTATTLRQLLSLRNKQKNATCYFNPDAGVPEPLLTIWEPKSFPLLTEHVQRGNLSPRYFLKTNDVEQVMPANSDIFININDENARDQWLKRG